MLQNTHYPVMLTTATYIIALIALVLSLYWIILRNSSSRIIYQYKCLSKNLNLELELHEPKLAGLIRSEPAAFGTYRGREISFSAPGKGLQNTRQIETVLKVKLRDEILNAQFASAGIMGRLRQRDSGKKSRWFSGDKNFDATIDIRSDQGERLKSILTTEILQWLAHSLKKHRAQLYIGNGVIAYTEIGLIANDAMRERLEQTVEFLCDFAQDIDV